MTLKNIVWLASYPKSGNTWTRIFLSNYLLTPDKPMPINQVHRLGMGDSIAKSYRMVCKGPLNLRDHMQTLQLRNKVLRGIANNRADVNFVKTHNASDRAFGVPLIPAELTRGAVYIIRNPLDVVLSYSRHFGLSLDATVESFGRTDHTTAADDTTVTQYLGTWSGHVRGWIDRRDFPIHVMRYEDMLENPRKSFTDLLSFIGVPVDAERLDRAIEHSSFDNLRKQEDESGFIEKSASAARFFHSGTAGQWKTELTEAQIRKMQTDHQKVMQKFGYL